MICKLGLVQGHAEVLWCLGPGTTAWLYAPYQTLILRNVKIQAQQNYLPQPQCWHSMLTSFPYSKNEKSLHFPHKLKQKTQSSLATSGLETRHTIYVA